MKKLMVLLAALAFGLFTALPEADAKARTGSTRVGVYTKSGKGSHYQAGHASSTKPTKPARARANGKKR